LAVFVLDKRKKPPIPYRQKRARLLLARGRVVVQPRHPMTIRLKDGVVDLWPVRVKIDPGSKTTGVVSITGEDGNSPAKVPCLFELARRGRRRRLG
jgi:RRXRR protein